MFDRQATTVRYCVHNSARRRNRIVQYTSCSRSDPNVLSTFLIVRLGILEHYALLYQSNAGLPAPPALGFSAVEYPYLYIANRCFSHVSLDVIHRLVQTRRATLTLSMPLLLLSKL